MGGAPFCCTPGQKMRLGRAEPSWTKAEPSWNPPGRGVKVLAGVVDSGREARAGPGCAQLSQAGTHEGRAPSCFKSCKEVSTDRDEPR